MNLHNDWIKSRMTSVHMTIRDVDCQDFDVDAFIDAMQKLHIDFFSFFAGGYVTTYPSALEYQRISPYLEKGKDLAAEIVTKARAAGIVPIPMVDLGILPSKAAKDHPDWAQLDINGNMRVIDDENVQACLLSGWQTEYSALIVKELIDRYPQIGGMKFGGSSYGFSANICYCKNCREGFYHATGLSLPESVDWDSDTYHEYVKWRYEQTALRVQQLYEMVKSQRDDLIVMGNSVCFGNPTWTISSSLDQEKMVEYQDIIQIEAQERVFHTTNRDSLVWQSLTMSSEEAIYMQSLTDKPVIIVASYFLAWPWRRTAMEYAEQKYWLYQIIANGANPMINLSGGPPAVHEDKRGFKAPQEVFDFYTKYRNYYEADSPIAKIAIVYSQSSLIYYGKENAFKSYVACLRGFERVLLDKHIAFDIISISDLKKQGSKYSKVILANTACMSDEDCASVREYVKLGGVVLATAHTSLFDEFGKKRSDFGLSDLFGVNYLGSDKKLGVDERNIEMQTYGVIPEDSSAFPSFTEVKIVPVDHFACTFSLDEAELILKLSPTFRVFPEGLSYPMSPIMQGDALAVKRNFGDGLVYYFGWPLGREYYELGQSDICNVIMDVLQPDNNGFTVIGPKSVNAFFREQKNRINIHLVNRTGGDRFLTEIVPVCNIEIRYYGRENIRRVFSVQSNREVSIQKHQDSISVLLPKLDDYDIIAFEIDR
ncbi:alpha-amylase family protein [uncultured Sphaerochaeta sp.]|uniref:alpha-amylase family protein n=1 Tax=uncultured Sphaerochaeta sp. TaxID=886478 RepID=UPI002A0A8EF2|nr:alpha-amylase family protein [uncultured Sphaerochaeta sp.]